MNLQKTIETKIDKFCLACGGKCCTNILLTQRDINRIQNLGYDPGTFVVDKHWMKCLWVGCKAFCFFLKEGRCAIYNCRPELCHRFICFQLDNYLTRGIYEVTRNSKGSGK